MVDVLGKEAFGMLVGRKLDDISQYAAKINGQLRDRVSPYKSEDLTNMEQLLTEVAEAIRRYRNAAS